MESVNQNPGQTTEPTVLTPEEDAHKKEASTSMILGIVADVLVWYPVLNIAGLVLAIIALVKSGHNRDFAVAHGIREHGMNIAGKWCGIGGIVVGAITVILFLAAVAIGVLFVVGLVQNPAIFENFPAAFPQFH